jgi:two-component system response regulator WspF
VVFVSAASNHLVIGSDFAFHYSAEPKDNPYKPSVDTFFASLAGNWPRRDTALLLTGMGRDGAKGMLELKKKGWYTIAQDKKSSVVYGMPKAAADLNAAMEIAPLDAIAEIILKRIKNKELVRNESK